MAGRIAKSTYGELVASIVATTESITPAKTAKIAYANAKGVADNDEAKGVCFRFQKGTCTGENCLYNR